MVETSNWTRSQRIRPHIGVKPGSYRVWKPKTVFFAFSHFLRPVATATVMLQTSQLTCTKSIRGRSRDPASRHMTYPGPGLLGNRKPSKKSHSDKKTQFYRSYCNTTPPDQDVRLPPCSPTSRACPDPLARTLKRDLRIQITMSNSHLGPLSGGHYRSLPRAHRAPTRRPNTLPTPN